MADTVLATMRRGAMPTLPYDAEVEYLESTGTQYIDTGVRFDRDDMSYDIVFSPQTSVAYSGFFGVASSPTSMIKNNDLSQVSLYGYSAYLPISYDWGDEIRVERSKILTRITVDGVVKTESIQKGQFMSNEIDTAYLFWTSGNGGGSGGENKAKAKVMYLCIMVGSSPVLDFIPVRVGNVGYMFDRVSGQLFGNAGTGAFVVGPDKPQIAETNLGVLAPLKEEA